MFLLCVCLFLAGRIAGEEFVALQCVLDREFSLVAWDELGFCEGCDVWFVLLNVFSDSVLVGVEASAVEGDNEGMGAFVLVVIRVIGGVRYPYCWVLCWGFIGVCGCLIGLVVGGVLCCAVLLGFPKEGGDGFLLGSFARVFIFCGGRLACLWLGFLLGLVGSFLIVFWGFGG